MKLDIDVQAEKAGTSVVSVAGSIDLDSRTALRDAAERTLDTSGLTSLVIDMSAVQFMDSTGIGTIVDIASRADELGIGFVIRDPSKRVQRVLEITGLASHWSIVRTDQQSLS